MSIMAAAVSARLDLALAAADAASDVILRWFRNPALPTETKRDGSPVTVADREAEQVIRRMIESKFPEDLVLGEEEGLGGRERDGAGAEAGAAGYRWIVDPIDGTASFVCGVPLFGTMIGVQSGGADGPIVAGVIAMPLTGERVFASQARGAWHIAARGASPTVARVSSVSTLAEGVLTTTSIDYFRRGGMEAAYLPICRAAKWSRGWSDCYAFVLLATGRVEAVVEPVVHPWDIAAAASIIEEAGGRLTDYTGRIDIHAGHCVATNGHMHGEMLQVVSDARRAR